MDTFPPPDLAVMPTHGKRGRVTVQLRNLTLFRKLLDERNMTLPELARGVGCSHGHVRDMHCGHTTRVGRTLADKIETLLECQGEIFTPLPDTTQVSTDRDTNNATEVA